MQLGAALAKDVLEHARRLACDVLEDEDTHRLDPSLFVTQVCRFDAELAPSGFGSKLLPYRGRRGGA